MLNFLKKIRELSDEEKNFILFWLVLIMMFLVFVCWYFLSGIEIGSVIYDADKKEGISGIKFITDLFKNSFNDLLSNFTK